MAGFKERFEKSKARNTLKEEKVKRYKKKSYTGVFYEEKRKAWACRAKRKDSNGKLRDKILHDFKTALQAKQARDDLIYEWKHMPPVDVASEVVNDKDITLGELYGEFISKYASYDREKSTLTRYDSLFRNHLSRWENRNVASITANELSEYLFKLTSTLSYAYIMSIHKFMKVLWNFAYDKEYLSKNIIDKVTTPKAGSEEGQIKIYTQAELDMFERRFASTHSITAFKIGRATGVRVGECYGLLWSDIDWENHTMKIERQMVFEDKMWTLRNTKTKAAIRTIDLQDSIYFYLKELRETQLRQKDELGAAYKVNRVAIDMGRGKPKKIRDDLELINIKSNGEMLTPDSEKFLGRISRQELPVNFKFHNLRHTHASWLAEHNVPAIVTKKRLGHSKEETTLRYYTHITQGMRDDLLTKLNNDR